MTSPVSLGQITFSPPPPLPPDKIFFRSPVKQGKLNLIDDQSIKSFAENYIFAEEHVVNAMRHISYCCCQFMQGRKGKTNSV